MKILAAIALVAILVAFGIMGTEALKDQHPINRAGVWIVTGLIFLAVLYLMIESQNRAQIPTEVIFEGQP